MKTLSSSHFGKSAENSKKIKKHQKYLPYRLIQKPVPFSKLYENFFIRNFFEIICLPKEKFFYPAQIFISQQNLLHLKTNPNYVHFEFIKTKKPQNNFSEHDSDNKLYEMLNSMQKGRFFCQKKANLIFMKNTYSFIENFILLHKDDVLFLVTEKTSKENIIYFELILNEKLKQWCFSDNNQNLLSSNSLENLAKLWVFQSFEHFKIFLAEIENNKTNFCEINIKTFIGVLNLKWEIQFFYDIKEKKNYIFFIHSKEHHPHYIDFYLQWIKKNIQESLPKENLNWGKLLELYYFGLKRKK